MEITKVTIEFYQGTEITGPQKNLKEIKNLVKKIEAEMKEAYKDALRFAGESRAMDDRDDIIYDHVDEMSELGFEIVEEE